MSVGAVASKVFGLIMPKGTGLLSAIYDQIPSILTAMVIGLVIYNPSGHSFIHYAYQVIFGQLGYIDSLPFYKQPVLWIVLVLAVIFGWISWMYWEVAQEELKHFLAFIIFMSVLNGLLLSLISALGFNVFSWTWVHWQISPVLAGAAMWGAKLPKIRRSQTAAITAGGGRIDTLPQHQGEQGQDVAACDPDLAASEGVGESSSGGSSR